VQAAVTVVADLQAIQLQCHALLADTEEATDADDEAFDGLGILFAQQRRREERCRQCLDELTKTAVAEPNTSDNQPTKPVR
jgi:hypothetical protein